MRLSLISIFSFLCLSLTASEVEFVTRGPGAVELGNIFNIEFALNKEGANFTAPDFAGFDVVAGPYTSQGRSISWVNGKKSESINLTYTFSLQAQKEGTLTIAPAKVTVDSKTYSSNALQIQVVKGSASATQSGSGGVSVSQSGTLAKDDILLRTIVNKRSVFKGEPVKVTIKLYTRVPVDIENFKYPVFNGFWSQEIPLKRQQSQRETLNNKVYESYTLKQYLLFPQQSGELTIDEINSSVIAQIQTSARQRQSLIDEFFGAGPAMQQVRRELIAKPITINVKQLPSGAPESFTGAVGSFKLSSELSAQNVAANSATTYTLKLSGEGNLPLIQAPTLNLPNSFEQYTMKTTESLNTSENGVSGYRHFEYPFIARAQGDYTIPSVKFSYFDPNTAEYVEINSPSYEIKISPDTTERSISSGAMISGLSKEDLKILGQDIRFIKLGASGMTKDNGVFLFSGMFFVSLALVFAIFIACLILLSKYIKQRQNQVFVKGKKANKVALARFKAASVFMKQDDKRRFYEEMLRALWGYVSDKFNIPVANLTKQNAFDELAKRGVDTVDAEMFTDLISGCEYAQYSPDTSSKMQEYFNQGVNLISKYESIIK
ncbi:MAG: BatD family protein [Rikenellaceae bacterium]